MGKVSPPVKPGRTPPTWRRLTRALPGLEALQLTLDGRALDWPAERQRLHEYFARRSADQFLLTAIEAMIAAAREAQGLALRQSQWIFDGFPAAELAEPLTWAENPHNDRNWQWQFHSFFMLPPLMAAHRTTQDDWYLERGTGLILSWIEVNVGATPPCEFTWHDHATALRLENWLYWLEYVRQRRLAPSALERLLPALHQQAEILSNPTFYNANTNHGHRQAMALFLAGAALPELAQAATWRQVGLARLQAETAFAFATDGVHVENSPAYHLQVLHNAALADRACRAYTGAPLHAGWDEVVAAAMDFAAYITRPNGRLPPVGDSRETGLLTVCRALKKSGLAVSESMLYAATQGRAGQCPAAADRFFPASGYAILRDAWHAAADYDQGVYLLFKAGFLSTYHRHDDDLSVMLYAFGEDWLIDAGLYRYAEKDALRQHVRSCQAHNVVTVDGVSAVRKLAGERLAWLEAYRSVDGCSVVTGVHRLFPGFECRRRVEYLKPKRLRLHDWVTASHPGPHRFQSLFHVPADKNIEVASDAVYIRSPQSGRCLTMTLPARLYRVRLVTGQTEPTYQGWRSTQYGRIEPAHCVVLETEAGSLASVIELTLQ